MGSNSGLMGVFGGVAPASGNLLFYYKTKV